jgi:NAD(P)-dependent dehydrogenase (short-subunit alcohol dehydrogenase family)
VIVVTGASSGIGRASARLLHQRGHQVLAGVRKESDAESLRGEGMRPLILDVTSAESIAQALEDVRAIVGPEGLRGLVNNAGTGLSGPVECLRLEDIRWQYEVNVFGQLAVIQAFLPLLRQARGRLVNIGSVGDRLTIPFGGALCSSKCAFASFTDALRMELAPWGIHVCLIEPASIRTPAVDKTLGEAETVIASWPAEGARRYGAMFRSFCRSGAERERRGSPPEVVGAAILHALTARRPRTRYPVGADSTLLTLLPRILPEWLLDKVRQKLMGVPTGFGSLDSST